MTETVFSRLRAADPARALGEADVAVTLTEIVAGPGDPRVGGAGRRPSRATGRIRRGGGGIWRGGRRLSLLAVCLIGIGAAGATAGTLIGLGALSHSSPRRLFLADSVARFPGAPHQRVDLRTVRRAATFTVPGDGRFQFWIAYSRRGSLCKAIRQPDGTWADVGRSSRYPLGGPVPGCGVAAGADADGFSYYAAALTTPRGEFRIAYGYAPQTGHPVAVRDRLSGATAAIGDGRYFAIVIPICRGAGCGARDRTMHYFQLETVDAAGRVLVRDRRDPGM